MKLVQLFTSRSVAYNLQATDTNTTSKAQPHGINPSATPFALYVRAGVFVRVINTTAAATPPAHVADEEDIQPQW